MTPLWFALVAGFPMFCSGISWSIRRCGEKLGRASAHLHAARLRLALLLA
jgi:hypothetical protein